MEDGTVRRLGGSEDRPVDVRVVCASRTSLATLVEEGRLREDVAFRLNALPLELPPLRERAEDVPALIERFAEGLEFTPEARDALVRYRWPGNVRQLENELKRLEAVHGGEGPVGVDALGSELRQGLAVGGALRVGGTLQDAVEALEREILGRELEAAGGNRSLVARRMGLSRGGLRLKMKRYGLS